MIRDRADAAAQVVELASRAAREAGPAVPAVPAAPAVPPGPARTSEPGAAGLAAPVVVLIDGLTGSGKSELAREVASRVGPAAAVLELELLVPGWRSLAVGVSRARRLLAELDRTGGAVAPAWDWARSAPAPSASVAVRGGEVLVVEGCGALSAGAQRWSRLRPVRVLLETPDEERHRRIALRDAYAWDVAAWESQERLVRRSWQQMAWAGPELLVR